MRGDAADNCGAHGLAGRCLLPRKRVRTPKALGTPTWRCHCQPTRKGADPGTIPGGHVLSGSAFGCHLRQDFAKHVPCGIFPLLPMTRRPPWPLSAPSGADLSLYVSRPCPMHVLIHASDIWDHRFLSNCCQGVTVHHSEKAPASVLDLGCGSGYWAIEAAKQWPVSRRVLCMRFPDQTTEQHRHWL